MKFRKQVWSVLHNNDQFMPVIKHHAKINQMYDVSVRHWPGKRTIWWGAWAGCQWPYRWDRPHIPSPPQSPRHPRDHSPCGWPSSSLPLPRGSPSHCYKGNNRKTNLASIYTELFFFLLWANILLPLWSKITRVMYVKTKPSTLNIESFINACYVHSLVVFTY